MAALDRNHNGQIDNGQELFGNFTPQPSSIERNGFLALAEFDKRINGGNDDGLISAADTVFASLHLWVDQDHNGQSDSRELFSLDSRGIVALETHYRTTRRRDRWGNEFRYLGRVHVTRASDVARIAWDVILLTNPPPSS